MTVAVCYCGQYRCAGVVRDGRAADAVEARACPNKGATVAAVNEAPVEDGEGDERCATEENIVVAAPVENGEGEERQAPVEDGEVDERHAAEGNIVVAAPVKDGEVDECHTAKGDIIVAALVEDG